MRKAVFLDVDGTLTIDSSSWSKIHDHFGLMEFAEKHTAMFMDGKIDYDQWAQLDAELWKGKPFDGIKAALLPPVFRTGVKEAIQKLRIHGFDIILVSGGIDVLVNEVARLINADYAFSNSIGHDNGTLNGEYKIGVDSKGQVVEEIARDLNYDLSKSLAIGDNFNDISMFEKVGYSLAINPKTEIVEKAASTSITTNNFETAVEHLLNVVSS